jgi:predicted HTH transcriptional regulator
MSETFSQRIKDDIARFVAEPTRDGLTELIRYFGGEFDQYELKEAWPPVPRMAKTALAIANSGGGVILFGIRDSTLEPVGLAELMSKQQVFDTFREYVPSVLLEEISLLDFEYSDAAYAPLRGKQIQVLAIPDIPDGIPFVCEGEWHQGDDHVRRGAIYVRSGTNTREANYDQIQRMLNHRLEHTVPNSSTTRVRRELDQLRELFVARGRLSPETLAHGNGGGPDSGPDLRAYLDGLIVRKQALLERALGLPEDGESSTP